MTLPGAEQTDESVCASVDAHATSGALFWLRLVRVREGRYSCVCPLAQTVGWSPSAACQSRAPRRASLFGKKCGLAEQVVDWDLELREKFSAV